MFFGGGFQQQVNWVVLGWLSYYELAGYTSGLESPEA